MPCLSRCRFLTRTESEWRRAAESVDACSVSPWKVSDTNELRVGVMAGRGNNEMKDVRLVVEPFFRCPMNSTVPGSNSNTRNSEISGLYDISEGQSGADSSPEVAAFGDGNGIPFHVAST